MGPCRVPPGGPCSPLGLTVPFPPMVSLGGTLRVAAPALWWPLLTMPCLTIQSLRLFSPLPPIWVRKGHTERWQGQGQGHWCTGSLLQHGRPF